MITENYGVTFRARALHECGSVETVYFLTQKDRSQFISELNSEFDIVEIIEYINVLNTIH